MAAVTDRRHAPHIPISALGWSLGISFAITYTICVVFDLIFPSQSMTSLWNPLLPRVDGIDLGSYAPGVVETLLYGWFVALIFGPLFNFFAERTG